MSEWITNASVMPKDINLLLIDCYEIKPKNLVVFKEFFAVKGAVMKT
jgi:hypothetical protein